MSRCYHKYFGFEEGQMPVFLS